MTRVLRWLTLLPGSYLCGLAAYLLADFVASLAIDTVLVAPRDWWGRRAIIDGISYAMLGSGLVYAGFFLAPSHQRRAAYMLAGTCILLALIFVSTSIFVGDWSSTYQMPAVAAGAGSVSVRFNR